MRLDFQRPGPHHHGPRSFPLRSTLPLRLSFLFLAVPVAIASGTMLGACNVSAQDSAFAKSSPDVPDSVLGDDGTTTSGTESNDASLAPAIGSPLCGIRAGSCTPDDDGKRVLAKGAVTCVDPSPADGGPEVAADGGSSALACRITAGEPTCGSYTADPEGVDGVSCESSKSCAPGFECAEGEKGGVCRRSCCGGTCEGFSSQNGGPTFCDVQRLLPASGEKDVRAPVCMPIKTCKLLAEGQCGDRETCAIVTEKGTTGCVALGAVNAAESCERDHCAADLTCLGNPGDRRCFTLCRTEASDCGDDKMCTTGSVFQDTSFGVCKSE